MNKIISKKLILFIVFLLFPFSVIYPFGKNKVNREVFNWNIMKTIHFDIYYPYGIEELAINAARISEEAYVHLANYLKHELTEVIPIIIYPSHIDFQENNIIPQILGEGTGGFTEVFKSRVVTPFTGSYNEFRHVLTHELVHAFQYNILINDTSGENLSRFSLSRVPLWIMEGMAEYLSIGYDETADMVMRDVLFNDKYASLMDLTKLYIRSPYLLYKEGQAFFYFLEEKYGKEKIGELLRDIRDISNFNKALKIGTGKEIKELSLEWIRYFKKRYYPIIKGKKFDEEEGEQLTFHQKTRSMFNVCPAVSPDGREIAYLTNRDIYSTVSIITVKKKKNRERKIRSVLQGDTSSKFEGMHLLSNNLSWSSDGKYITLVSQSRGRDVIFMLDQKDGSIEKEIQVPFRSVKDPSLSKDGFLVAFIGQLNSFADLYIYDIKKSELQRITNDLYSERYPCISKDNNYIIYSSNWNKDGDYERDDYNIFKFDLKTRTRTLIIGEEGNDLQADISADGSKIIYISNRAGIYNAYLYDIRSGEGKKITDVLCGIFYPRWFPDNRRVTFVSYQNIGYDLFVKEIKSTEETDKKESNIKDTEHVRVNYPLSYFNLSDAFFEEYTTKVNPDLMLMGIAATWGYGFAGFVRMSISDYLGDHRVVVSSDYLRYRDEGDINYDAAYYYLRYRWDFGLGIFHQSNPFGIITLNSINDLIHNIYWDTRYINHKGVYSIAMFPFSKFFRFNIKATSSRYEINYSASSNRTDTYANLNQLSLSMNYDNVLWGYMNPLDGMRGRVEIEQSLNVTGQDYSYTTIDIDIRRYFLLSKRYVIALRGSGGKIFGRDSDNFRYYIGGFSTLRGHPFFEYDGKNVFLFSSEFRFLFIEGIKFGWPLFFRMGGIGGVLFADCGSAWDEHFDFFDSETGKFDDFKADIGFGFRLALYPVIILKLDYAWPYYYNSFGKRDIIFSLGFEY
ncbi:MAG: BamA/TamA family outer membrane protein [Spirochaetota bacterium]|nr:BamA/TamA family outer membrane protein [Spirochaetota bacterium]